MSSLILVPICLISWLLTFFRIPTIYSKDARDKLGISLNIWLLLFFFSITLTFMIAEVKTFFDSLTFSNFSLLISHVSILLTIYFSVSTSLSVIGQLSSKKAIRLIGFLLGVAIITLLVIYVLFISKMPPVQFFNPQSLPEVIFKVITCGFGTFLCVVVIQTYLTYLPAKKFILMRLRAIVIILCAFVTGVYLVVRGLIFTGYFWPVLLSPVLFSLSSVLLVCAALLFFIGLSSNKIYSSFVLLSNSLEYWRAFQDLQYLIWRLMQLFPPISLKLPKIFFLQFLFDPEYYLYCAVIRILDGRTMLSDFLAEMGDAPVELADWELEEGDTLMLEARQVDKALQTVNPPDDFYEIVAAYRSVSKTLFLQRVQE